MLKLQRAASERDAAERDAVVPPAAAQDRQDAQAVSARQDASLPVAEVQRSKKSKKRQTPWTNLQPRPLAQKVVFIEAMLLCCCCGCHFC